MIDRERAQQDLERLKELTTRFYNGKAGKAQLVWLEQFERNLVQEAITSSDSVKRLSCLDQAKGVRAFRAYIGTLTTKD